MRRFFGFLAVVAIAATASASSVYAGPDVPADETAPDVRTQLLEQLPAPNVETLFLDAFLDGDNVVPGPGDPDGVGFASVFVRPETGELCYSVLTVDTAPLLTAGIYQGAAGTNGPLVIDFDIAANGDAACIAVNPAVRDAVFADPAGHYVQFTTDDYREGALRDQLRAFDLGELTFAPTEGPPGTVVTVNAVTPCEGDTAAVALVGAPPGLIGTGAGLRIAILNEIPPTGSVSLDGFFAVGSVVPVADDGLWTAELPVPLDAVPDSLAFVAAICGDPLTQENTVVYLAGFYRVSILIVEPRFTG